MRACCGSVLAYCSLRSSTWVMISGCSCPSSIRLTFSGLLDVVIFVFKAGIVTGLTYHKLQPNSILPSSHAFIEFLCLAMVPGSSRALCFLYFFIGLKDVVSGLSFCNSWHGHFLALSQLNVCIKKKLSFCAFSGSVAKRKMQMMWTTNIHTVGTRRRLCQSIVLPVNSAH